MTSIGTRLGHLAVSMVSSFLKALENVGVDVEGRFSVILNKCTSDVMVHCEKHNQGFKRRYAAGRKCDHFWRYS